MDSLVGNHMYIRFGERENVNTEFKDTRWEYCLQHLSMSAWEVKGLLCRYMNLYVKLFLVADYSWRLFYPKR